MPTAIKVIGIRAGEKLHEVMFSSDDAHRALEFKDHYILQPSIHLYRNTDYKVNAAKEKGRPIPRNFEYQSGTNLHFLGVRELRRMNDRLKKMAGANA